MSPIDCDVHDTGGLARSDPDRQTMDPCQVSSAEWPAPGQVRESQRGLFGTAVSLPKEIPEGEAIGVEGVAIPGQNQPPASPAFP